MANEITLSASLALNEQNASPFVGGTLILSMSGNKVLTRQAIGTSAEALVLTDITAPAGLVIVHNADTTNYVELGLDSGVSTKVFARLYPGETAAWCPSASGTIYAKAHTATCACDVFACDAITVASYAPATTPAQSSALNQIVSINAASGGASISLTFSKAWPAQTDASYFAFVYRTFTITSGYTAVVELFAGQKTVFISGVTTETTTLTLDNAGADPLADISVAGKFALLPMPAGTLLYGTGADCQITTLQAAKNIA